MLAGLQNVTFEFGARVIVEDATWHIQPGERIGLIGYNGTGKSTLLKLLVGEYQPSKGTVERSRGISIGYLHQDLLSFDTNDSILQVALGAFERVLQLEKEIEELGKELEKPATKKHCTNTATNFRNWKPLAVIIFIIKQKKYYKDLDLQMQIYKDLIKNLAADGVCECCLPK
jgi:ATPase subunit of ABC transporter with duplicated ATPase domains